MGASRKGSAKVSKTLKRFREETVASGRKKGKQAMAIGVKARRKGY